MTGFWPDVLARLLAHEDLSTEDAAAAMRRMLSGEATPAQVAAFAAALQSKGETPAEVGGLADAMLELAPAVETPGPVLDTTGTGGGRLRTFNVSTLAAIVAVGAGALVAKHGTRGLSSRCGSADLLEALGVKVSLTPQGVARCLADCRIAFMFAPAFHPAMAKTAIPRKEMGVRTVFDVLLPITNPARPQAQLVGVADERIQPALAGALAARGTHAYVVRGDDGMDEITTTGPTALHEARGGVVMQRYLVPIEMGVSVASPAELGGGDVERNVPVAKSVLSGEKGAPRDVVAVNAAATLILGGLAEDLTEGLERAFESIDSGEAAKVLSTWVEVSNRI